MLKRYSHEPMESIWTDASKFGAWLKVELAVLKARESRGDIPAGIVSAVEDRVWMNDEVAEAINRRDRVIQHDLNAFLEIMRVMIILPASTVLPILQIADDGEFNAAIDEALGRLHESPEAGLFHDGMTSYDTEEPAMALLLRQASDVICEDLFDVDRALRKRAAEYHGCVMMGRTHGQHAQPITFGVKLLGYLEMIIRAEKRLTASMEEAIVMKLSGAVGMYGTLEPEIEEEVGGLLHLPVAPIATQIVSLDRRAQLTDTFAEIAVVIEKIAHDLWLLAQTEIGEIREPFGKKQKGSSAMPHKKNPIRLEQLFGLARLIRSYAHTMLGNVATAHERDISHSSVERIAIPDAFGLLDHMLHVLIKIIQGMEVFPERMEKNIRISGETFASQRVEQLLKHLGMGAERAYRVVQEACFQAIGRGTSLKDEIWVDPEAKALLTNALEELAQCFNLSDWIKYESVFYERMGVE